MTVMRLEKALRAGREGTGAPSELLLEAVARPGKVVTPADRLQPPQPSHLRHGAPGGNPSYDRTPAHRQGDSHVGTRRASRVRATLRTCDLSSLASPGPYGGES